MALYYAFQTMTTVGYGDVVPSSTEERWFAIAAMVLGVGFYSYILATVTSIVTSGDQKSAVYHEKMDSLASWMRHHKFDNKLRRRTRNFYRRYYAERSAIDEKSILENLAPSLQDEVSHFLLHDFIKDHPLFRELPPGVLYKIFLITRTLVFEESTRVAYRGAFRATIAPHCWCFRHRRTQPRPLRSPHRFRHCPRRQQRPPCGHLPSTRCGGFGFPPCSCFGPRRDRNDPQAPPSASFASSARFLAPLSP